MDNCGGFLVSIIVPVYNVASYVRECVESIQRQTYHEIEILVVDDGSEDGSGRICEEIALHDNRMKVIKQQNAGVVAARDNGVENATGKYLMFIDADDWIEPDMVKKLVAQINSADLITSGVFYQETPDRTVMRYDEFSEGTYSGKTQMDKLLKSMLYDKNIEYLQRFTPWIFNKLYRSDLVKKIYREVAPDITFAEDSVFLYKYLLRCHSVIITHQSYYHYRYRQDSAMHAFNQHMLIDINKVYLTLETDFKNHELRESLLFQLQKWIMILSCRAINSHMGFCNQAHVPEFIANTNGLENKKIVLYGAGKAGQDTYIQLKRFHYQIVLWVDKNYSFYHEKGMQVVSPDEIFHKNYDVIFIAVSEKSIAQRIKKELSDKGVSSSDLVWNKPMRVFD